MRFIAKLSTVLAALVLSLPLSAQQQPAQQQQAARPQVVTQFDNQTIAYLLADMRASAQVMQDPNGGVTYRAVTEDGINLTLAPRACNDQGVCTALMMVVVFDGLNVRNYAQLDALINQYNDRNPTAKVLRSPQGVVALQGYIDAAYGISYRNAQAQMLQFGQDLAAVGRALVAFERSQQGG